MLITFFNIKDTDRFEFNPQGQTVNQAYYVEILKWLCEAVCGKRPELWPSDWIFNHDKGPAKKALSVKQSLAWNRTPNLSPDLAPNDFCFQKLSLP